MLHEIYAINGNTPSAAKRFADVDIREIITLAKTDAEILLKRMKCHQLEYPQLGNTLPTDSAVHLLSLALS